ncbi:lysin A [Mycobacterium phage Azrael100]|nr:lysin A [Mycobacterium phage Azrael100]
MDVGTLRRVMSPTDVSDAKLAEYLPHFVEAMNAAQINNKRRFAAWCSQIGHESGGLKYMAEIKTSDPSWSWDRTRYRGRGPIQLTWQSNYRKFGVWCKKMGYVSDSELFVNQPELVEQPRWGFLAAAWYWMEGGPKPGQINGFADAGNILAVSRCVNGWVESQLPNGWTDRQARWNRVLAIPFDGSYTPATTPEPGFTGDPWWLADVLRAEGLRVFEVDGWQNRGQGDQGTFWGVMFHHTGSPNETPEGIAFHPTLGLAAHILIKPNGDVWVCGIGKANHAGRGDYPGLPTNNANPVMIGVEVAILPRKDAPHREGWPDVQYDATVKVHAAILRKLGLRADRCISHREWGERAQGKWDPGAIDMNIHRRDVQARIDSFNPVGGDGGWLMALSDAEQRELLDKVRQLWGASFNPVGDTAIFGNPDPNHKIPNKDRLTYTDGNVWDSHVADLAKAGVDWAIEIVVRTAAGRGPLGDVDWVKAYAVSVLESIPNKEEVLGNWDPS